MTRALPLGFLAGLLVTAAIAGTRSNEATIKKYHTAAGSRFMLEDIDTSTDEATRTLDLDVERMSRLVILVDLDDANTDCDSVTTTCTASLDDGTTYGGIPSVSIASGVGTAYDFHYSAARAHIIDGQVYTYDVWGYTDVRCVFAGVGTCSGGDTISVQANVSAAK